MSDITIEKAKRHLELWLAADEAVSLGQSYTIDGRTLTRADARVVIEKVNYWRRQVRMLSGRGGIRVYQGLPR